MRAGQTAAATPFGESGPPPIPDGEWLSAAVLGGGLPPDVHHHLSAAAQVYHLEEVAERHLRQARLLAPWHAATLIALYRFYFYKGRLKDALDIARLCLAKAAQDNKLPADWRQVVATDADFGRFDAPLPRFFLFTLKGYAYLHMRMGSLDEGLAAVLKLLELDPSDKVGAQVLLSVIQRMGEDDHD
ncbi:hypothetical protein FBZ87_108259 [Nitrospirillum amazonense]|uniref:Tetratricopeptide repeat protein n=1 Tax=Nitrospirillum amazonense TaxID=28077 RepID=A0A560JFI2_9PROT|nr:hypothetical protein [Nitrospirillum amazonense]TWB69968.1 hypothetical protein FBZ87_108259 [Nitrospirillum amazonense]